MKKSSRYSTVLFLFFALLATGCLKDNDTNPDVPKAALRIVNAYTSSTSIMYTDGNYYLTDPYYPLQYNTYTTALIFLYPGNKQLKVYNAERELIVETTIELKDSTSYTSFVYGNEEEGKNLITEDIAIEELGTKAGIRFLHLANNLENVNVYFGTIDEPVFSNQAPEMTAYTNDTDQYHFSAHSTGKQKIIITDLENNILVERNGEFDFKKGGYYSIILTGDKNSDITPLYVGVVPQ